MWEAYVIVFKFIKKLKGNVKKAKVLELQQNGTVKSSPTLASSRKTFKQRFEGRLSLSQASISDAAYKAEDINPPHIPQSFTRQLAFGPLDPSEYKGMGFGTGRQEFYNSKLSNYLAKALTIIVLVATVILVILFYWRDSAQTVETTTITTEHDSNHSLGNNGSSLYVGVTNGVP